MRDYISTFSAYSPARKVIFILRLVCFFVFLGRGWQHLFWDAPIRAFFWDELLLKFWVEAFTDLTWNEYVTSPIADQFLQGLTRFFGYFYILCAVISLILKPDMKKSSPILILGALGLFFLSLLYFKEQFYRIGQLLEYTSQFLAPVLLYLVLFSKSSLDHLKNYAKVAIALTFIGHGLYAVGYYPQPGHFVDMIINIFHVSESAARTTLVIAGIMDFVVAVLIFVPAVAYPTLIYACVWGGLTALARIVANFTPDFVQLSIMQWTFETLYRLPHAGLPLMVLILEKPPMTIKLFEKRRLTVKHNQVAQSTR